MCDESGPTAQTRRIPDLIDFVSPSDEAICLHEAGHACAAIVVGLIPNFVEFMDDENSKGRARNNIPAGDDQQRRLVACAAYAVEYSLFVAGRLTDAAGEKINTKTFIDLAVGGNAALDKVNYFGENRQRDNENKSWPKADDEEFMRAGQGLAKRLPMDLVTSIAEAMLNERRVERDRLLAIAASFLSPSPPAENA